MRRSRNPCLLLLILFLSLTSSPLYDSTRAVAQQDGRKGNVLFAIFGNDATSGTMEPFLIIEGGKFLNPVAGDSDGDEIKRFSNSYYSKGRKYRLLFGGSEAGTATVKKSSVDFECFRTGAEVSLSTTAKLNINVMAIATDSETLGSSKSSRRAPTAAERAASVSLAKDNFKQKGVPAVLVAGIQTVNLTALDLDADGKAELVGSFLVKKTRGGQERFVLFLLAEPEGQSYRAGVVKYASYKPKDIMSGGDIDGIGSGGLYTERLLDQLDLNGDGKAEVITITVGFEGVGYDIYEKQGGQWKSIYEFGNYRCAF
jgi:hypothetical protein